MIASASALGSLQDDSYVIACDSALGLISLRQLCLHADLYSALGLKSETSRCSPRDLPCSDIDMRAVTRTRSVDVSYCESADSHACGPMLAMFLSPSHPPVGKSHLSVQ